MKEDGGLVWLFVGSISRGDLLGNALLVNLGFCHQRGSKFKTYPSIVEGPVGVVDIPFPDGCGLFQHKMSPCHRTKMVLESFEGHNSEFKMTTQSPDPPDLSLVERLWDLLDKQVRSMEELQELKGSAANSLVPDTRAHHRGSGGVQVSMDRGCFGSKSRTNTIWGRWSYCCAWSVYMHQSRGRTKLASF